MKTIQNPSHVEISDELLAKAVVAAQKMRQPREAFERICQMFGIEDMDINKVEITAGLNELPRVVVTHVGIHDNKPHEFTKQFNLVPIEDGPE